MKVLVLKMFICLALLMSGSIFSQNLQPQTINYGNEDGVFINVDLMDNISVKLIDREFILKENKTLLQVVDNLKKQDSEKEAKFKIYDGQIISYKVIINNTNRQRTLALQSLENQKTITSNLKKNRLEIGFCISGEVFRSVWSPLLC